MSVAVRTEWHDGLEFELPTWDPTPVKWNEHGSWAKDPEVEARVIAAIKRAIPNHEELAAEALTATSEGWCHTFWGSHGCDRGVGHEGLCVCEAGREEGPCSAGLKYGDGDTLILWWGRGDRLELSYHYWRWYE